MRVLAGRLTVAVFGSMLLLSLGCGDDRVVTPEPQPEPVIDSPDALIESLDRAYGEKDLDAFASILANDPENAAEYAFIGPSASWGRNEEIRIHRRLFDPASPAPGEPQVPDEFWLQAFPVHFTRLTPWEERTELYRSETNPIGLPPEKWKAVGARFDVAAFLDLQTDADFLIEGNAGLVVIEDLDKHDAASGRFLLLLWQDDGSLQGIKERYR